MNAPRTCAELGVCQGRADCAACSYDAPARPARLSGVDYPFAPGVLQRCPRRAPAISPLGRLVLQASSVLAFAGALGALAGYLQAKGWPL